MKFNITKISKELNPRTFQLCYVVSGTLNDTEFTDCAVVSVENLMDAKVLGSYSHKQLGEFLANKVNPSKEYSEDDLTMIGKQLYDEITN